MPKQQKCLLDHQVLVHFASTQEHHFMTFFEQYTTVEQQLFFLIQFMLICYGFCMTLPLVKNRQYRQKSSDPQSLLATQNMDVAIYYLTFLLLLVGEAVAFNLDQVLLIFSSDTSALAAFTSAIILSLLLSAYLVERSLKIVFLFANHEGIEL